MSAKPAAVQFEGDHVASSSEQSLFQAGTRVCSRYGAGLVGESTGRTRDDGGGPIEQVRFPGQQSSFEMAEDMELADTELDDRWRVLASRFDDNKDTFADTVIEQAVTNGTLYDDLHYKFRHYKGPLIPTSREVDYRTAWAFIAGAVSWS